MASVFKRKRKVKLAKALGLELTRKKGRKKASKSDV